MLKSTPQTKSHSKVKKPPKKTTIRHISSINKPKQTKTPPTKQSRAPRKSFSTNLNQTDTPSLDHIPESIRNGYSTHAAIIQRRPELKKLDPLELSKIEPFSLGTNGKDYPPIVFVLGGPGSGKGTHSERLIQAAGDKAKYPLLQDKIYHVNVGGILRRAQFYYRDNKDTPVGDQNDVLSEDMRRAGPVLEEMMATGQILPSWVTVTLLRQELNDIMAEIDSVKKVNTEYRANIIIDGFPRSIENLESFEELIAIPSRLIIMDVPTEIMVDRVMSRGGDREDDKVDVVKNRINVFLNDTGRVLSRYSVFNNPSSAIMANKQYGVSRLGVKVYGDRETEETSKDFFNAYITLSNSHVF